MPQVPRVLLAVSSLSSGGAERVIAEMANAWSEKFAVGVMTLAGTESDCYSLLPGVERIALKLAKNSSTLWQALRTNGQRLMAIRSTVRTFRPEVVVSFVDRMNVKMLLALCSSGIPVIVSERTDPRRHEVGWFWQVARRWLYPRAARVVVQTEAVAEWARRFVPAGRVEVIANFVRDLPPVPVDGRSVQCILAAGRLGHEKGFDLLLRAFARSHGRRCGAKLTVLGEGPQRLELERLVAELGLSDVVRMPGVVKDPERWMGEAAIFVLPSRYEGFPNALLEAMAMGCAVVAADCDSGPREIVRDGEDGLLVPVEDVGALVKALDRLTEDRALRASLGRRAQEVRWRFAKDRILEQWEALIMAVLPVGQEQREEG